jgi:pimeloyl-ACP methyl ester carboxylesterase
MPKTTAPVCADALNARLQRLPLYRLATPLGQVAYRQAGAPTAPVTHVLLHGIGSGSATWVEQLARVQDNPNFPGRLVAWDAPGYGNQEGDPAGDHPSASDALPMSEPTAADYAQRLWAWLDGLQARDHKPGATPWPVTLVGHSLGCLMAASAARLRPHAVKRLVLLSPAQGYGRATPAERARKLNDRLDNLARLGPSGMAQLRGAAMVSPHASAAQVAFVQQVMAQINPQGYTQAARMLAQGDLLGDLAQLTCPIAVASGSADSITPPAGCQVVAVHVNAPYTAIAGAGHACAIEASDAVSRIAGLMEIDPQ